MLTTDFSHKLPVSKGVYETGMNGVLSLVLPINREYLGSCGDENALELQLNIITAFDAHSDVKGFS